MDFDDALLTIEPPTCYSLSLMPYNDISIDLLIDLSISLSPPGVFKISPENFSQKNVCHKSFCIQGRDLC